jgi:hypothetical protein
MDDFPKGFFKEKLDKIISEEEIRFAGFVNTKGDLVEGKFREDIVPFENDEEQKSIFRELALRISTRKNFDYSMGPVKYSASRREKLVMMSFPLKNMILLITAEPNVNLFPLKLMLILFLEFF